MTYITPTQKAPLDTIIDGLLKRLSNATQQEAGYVVARIVLETLNQNTVDSLSQCIAVLRDTADEIQRRLREPLLDETINARGDSIAFHTEYALNSLFFMTEKTCCGGCKPVDEWLTDEQFDAVEKEKNND